MKGRETGKPRSRSEILAEIASLPPSVQGTISPYTNTRKNGTRATYHNLQYTRGGRHRSFAIPVGKVDEFKAATAGGYEPEADERNAGRMKHDEYRAKMSR